MPCCFGFLLSLLFVSDSTIFQTGSNRLVSVLFRGMRRLEVSGGEVMDLLAVKEEDSFVVHEAVYS